MTGLGHPAEYYARRGLIPRVDALASVRQFVDHSDSLAGQRIIDIKIAGGLAFEVLPDHGLDIGAVWVGDLPVAWRSPLISSTSEPDFLSGFGGGMVVTCGLENIGPDSDGGNQHGTFHRTPAADVAVVKSVADGELTVTVTGTIGSIRLFGRRVVVRRTITTSTNDWSLTITDRIVNEGFDEVPLGLLYHVNFGGPFVTPQTEILVTSAEVMKKGSHDASPGQRASPAEWSRLPEPASSHDESVFEHLGIGAQAGMATVVVRPPDSGLEARVAWSTATLPRLFEWVWPASGSWALGIEPANAPLFGIERTGSNQSMPLLAPGEEVSTMVTIGFGLHANRR